MPLKPRYWLILPRCLYLGGVCTVSILCSSPPIASSRSTATQVWCHAHTQDTLQTSHALISFAWVPCNSKSVAIACLLHGACMYAQAPPCCETRKSHRNILMYSTSYDSACCKIAVGGLQVQMDGSYKSCLRSRPARFHQ